MIRNVLINVNDYVIVNTEQDSIGQVEDLHYLGSFPDPYRVKIRWLYRYSDLPSKCQKLNGLKKRPNELFIPAHDPANKPYNGSIQVIDALTIINVCQVEFLHEKEKFPRQTTEDCFYVQYAFDANNVIYSAKQYMDRVLSSSDPCVTKTEQRKCRTPKLSGIVNI